MTYRGHSLKSKNLWNWCQKARFSGALTSWSRAYKTSLDPVSNSVWSHEVNNYYTYRPVLGIQTHCSREHVQNGRKKSKNFKFDHDGSSGLKEIFIVVSVHQERA